MYKHLNVQIFETTVFFAQNINSREDVTKLNWVSKFSL